MAPDGVTPWPYQDTPPGQNASKACDKTDPALFYDGHYCLTQDYDKAPPGKKGYLQDEVVTNQVMSHFL
jgi:hypothetical protein